ncbi:MAG: D-aminoacyl-tRNA deacylase, partial [Elusimicrobiota bacterium]
TAQDNSFQPREISRGLVVLLGIAKGDTEENAKWLSDKIIHLRIFPDEKGKFDKSVKDVSGEILVISQFTLLGDCRGGRRPDFTKAASPDEAKLLYEKFISVLQNSGLTVKSGEFGALMLVEIYNDGPVTLIIDSEIPRHAKA